MRTGGAITYTLRRAHPTDEATSLHTDSAQVREEPEDPPAISVQVDDGAALGHGDGSQFGDGLCHLVQAIDRVAGVQVVVHRFEATVSSAFDEGLDLSSGPGAGRGPRGLDRGLHRIVFLARPGEARCVVFDVLAVWGLQQAESNDFAGIIAEDLANRHEVPEALGHLFPLQRDEAVVHPRARPLHAPGTLADHRLALVVRELEIDATSVDVEGRSEILVRHRVALDVPSWPSVAPRTRPRRFVPFRFLPEREVERILLRARGRGPSTTMSSNFWCDRMPNECFVFRVRKYTS